ncbi:MAG: hypothetical protein ACFN3D_05195, partial [Lancefieldella parvula]
LHANKRNLQSLSGTMSYAAICLSALKNQEEPVQFSSGTFTEHGSTEHGCAPATHFIYPPSTDSQM